MILFSDCFQFLNVPILLFSSKLPFVLTREMWVRVINKGEGGFFKFLEKKMFASAVSVRLAFRVIQRFQLIQHPKSAKHENKKQLKKQKNLDRNHAGGHGEHHAFLGTAIPWKKLLDTEIPDFLEVNIGVASPVFVHISYNS